jgi:biotin transport system permease protein
MLSLTSPIPTPAHHWPAGPKLLALTALTFVLFLPPPGWPALLLGLATLAAAALVARQWRFFGSWAQLFRPLLPFLVLLVIWHAITETPMQGAVVLTRMFAAVGAANLMTMTTRLADLQALMLWVLRPLAPILPTKPLSLAIALMIRFIPVMADRAAQLSAAWYARSPRRPHARLIAPLMLSALDDADHVAEALRARGGVM